MFSPMADNPLPLKSATSFMIPVSSRKEFEIRGSYLEKHVDGVTDSTPIFIGGEEGHEGVERLKKAVDWMDAHNGSLAGFTSAGKNWSMVLKPNVVQFSTTDKESVGVIPRTQITYIKVVDADFDRQKSTTVKKDFRPKGTISQRIGNWIATRVCKWMPCYSETCCLPKLEVVHESEFFDREVKASEVSIYTGGSAPAISFFILDKQIDDVGKLLNNPQGPD